MKHSAPRICLCAALAIVLELAAADVILAASGTWNKGTGLWLWQDASNWSGATPPGVGDTATFGRINWAANGIDMKGSSYNLNRIYGKYNGEFFVFYDSDFLTPNSNPLGTTTNFSFAPYGSLVEAANASPMLTLGSLFLEKQNVHTYYMPITVGTITTNGTDVRIYGDVTVTNNVNLTERSGWNDRPTFYADVTTPLYQVGGGENGTDLIATVEGKATLGTLKVIQGIARFKKDLHVDTQVILGNRNGLAASIEIGGRYTGNATYTADATLTTATINLLSGSTLAPGDSIGVLGGTALDVNINTNSNYEWEVGASPSSSTPGVGWDLSLANTFNIDGPLSFQIVESGLTESILPTDQFAVLGANSFDLSGIDLSTQVNFSVVPDQATWDITGAQLTLVLGYGDLDGITGNEDALVLSGISAQFGQSTVIPEPATLFIWSLLAALGLTFGWRRRKR